MRTTRDIASEVEYHANAFIEEAWRRSGLGTPPRIAASVVEYREESWKGPDLCLDFAVVARSVTLRIAGHEWRVPPAHGNPWTAAGIATEVDRMRMVCETLERRERAAARHRTGVHGVTLDQVVADSAMMLIGCHGGARELRRRVPEMLRRREFNDPLHGAYHPLGGLGIVTAEGGEEDGMPIAAPHPVTIGIRRAPDEEREDRLALRQTGRRLAIGLFDVQMPETYLMAAAGRTLASFCDLEELLDPEEWTQLGRRVILEAHHAGMADDDPVESGTVMTLEPSTTPIAGPSWLTRMRRAMRRGR